MKRICYITSQSGTINVFFMSQIKYLSSNGIDITIIAAPNRPLENLLGDNIHYIPLDIPRGVSVVKTIKSIMNMKKIFHKEKFDVIQYSTPNAALCASVAAKIEKVKVRNYHLMGFRYTGNIGLKRTILKMIEKVTCYLSTDIECVSNSNMEFGIKENIFHRNKVTVIGHGSTGGVDVKRFDYNKREEWRKKIRKTLNIGEKEFVFGFIGRITRDKGIHEILKAFKHLEEYSKLIIVGNTEEINTIDKQLWEWARNNKNIIIHDRVSNIEEYYAAIDILLLPSYREGFGNVIIEAAAVGTPSIVSNIPGPIDIIENIGGILCNSHDSKDLEVKMEESMKTNKFDGFILSKKTEMLYGTEYLNVQIFKRKIFLLNKIV